MSDERQVTFDERAREQLGYEPPAPLPKKPRRKRKSLESVVLEAVKGFFYGDVGGDVAAEMAEEVAKAIRAHRRRKEG
jgi:hypothetical protein